MLARAVLAIALVLLAVPGLAGAEVCCDEAAEAAALGAQIDEARVEIESSLGDLPSARRLGGAMPLDEHYASPALARVFRPPR